MALDERTGLTTREEDYPKLTTVAGCVEFLNQRERSA